MADYDFPSTIEKPLYISPDMEDKNLTSQYLKKTKEKQQIEKSFCNKYKSEKLQQFQKLTVDVKSVGLGSIKYNTLQRNTTVILPEVEHQMLLDLVKDAMETAKLIEELRKYIIRSVGKLQLH